MSTPEKHFRCDDCGAVWATRTPHGRCGFRWTEFPAVAKSAERVNTPDQAKRRHVLVHSLTPCWCNTPPVSTPDSDPAAIMAEHHRAGDSEECAGDNYHCGSMWPCPTYRLAAENAALREQVQREYVRGVEEAYDHLTWQGFDLYAPDVAEFPRTALGDQVSGDQPC